MNLARYDYVSSFEDYRLQVLKKHLYSYSLERRLFLLDNSRPVQQSAGFKVRRFNSGEMTGALFTTGNQSKVIPSPRAGSISTASFTLPARQKIRRSVENSALPLNYFLTLTFAPKQCHEWEKDENGNIRHDFAKFRLHRLLDALTKHCKRRYNEKLLYVWVAELQKNGNIHFHILLNQRLPVAYYRKLWTRGNIDVQYINDNNHAVNYMRKYMTKEDNAVIQGNRYNICAELRETMKPIEEEICRATTVEIKDGISSHASVLNVVKSMREEIESRGGIVLDFGFNIPRPRRERQYLDKTTGKKRRTKGVRRDLADNVYQLINSDESLPF